MRMSAGAGARIVTGDEDVAIAWHEASWTASSAWPWWSWSACRAG